MNDADSAAARRSRGRPDERAARVALAVTDRERRFTLAPFADP